MRKICNFIILFFMVLSFGFMTNSKNVSALPEDFTYTVGEDSITITGYIGTEPRVVIPSEIESLPVTAIDKEAFMNNKTINKVILPASITSIGINAFTNCTSLEKIDLSNTGVTVLNRYFYNCTSLYSVKLPAEIQYIPYDFCKKCTSLKKIDMSGTKITRISTSAFEECTSLHEVLFPKTLTSIGNRAFYGCTSLKKLSVSSNVTSIASTAFEKTGIISVSTPSGSYAKKYFAPIIKSNLPGADMKFKKSKYTLYVGEKKKLKVLNYVKKAKYKSSKKSVATVDSKGHVTAKKAGKTVIRVSINGYTSKCKVTVKNVKINKKSIVIAAGLTDSLYLTNNFKAKWKSSDESVVTVTSTGTIKAKAAGTAVITAKRKGKKYKCNITVYKNEISSGKTFKVTGSDNILLTLKKVERSGDTYKAYVHASYVGGTVTSVDNLNISVCDGSKPIFTKTVTHLNGDEYIITFSGSELKNAETDLTGVAPALWAKGNFKYIKYI